MKFQCFAFLLASGQLAPSFSFSYIDGIGGGAQPHHIASSGGPKKNYSPGGGGGAVKAPAAPSMGSSFLDNISNNEQQVSSTRSDTFIENAFNGDNAQQPLEEMAFYMDNIASHNPNSKGKQSYIYSGPSSSGSNPAPQTPTSYLDNVASASAAFGGGAALPEPAAAAAASSASYMDHLSPYVEAKKSSYVYTGPAESSPPGQSSYLDTVASAPATGQKKDSYIYSGPSHSSKPAQTSSYLDDMASSFSSAAANVASAISSAFTAPQADTGSYMDHLSPVSSTTKKDSYIYSGPSQSSQPAQQSSYLDAVSTAPSSSGPMNTESSGGYMDHLSPSGSGQKKDSYIYSGPSQSSHPAQQSSYLDTVSSAEAGVAGAADVLVLDGSASYMDNLSAPSSGTAKRDSYIYSGPSQSSHPAQQSSYLDNVAASPVVESSGSYMDHLSPQGEVQRDSYIYSGPSSSSKPALSSSYLDTVSGAAAHVEQAADSSGSYMNNLSPGSGMKKDSYIYQGPSQSSRPAQQSSYLDNVSSSEVASVPEPTGASMSHFASATSGMKKDSYVYQGPSQSSKPAQMSSYLDNVSSGGMKKDSYIYQGPSRSSKPAQMSSYLDNVSSAEAVSAPMPTAPAAAGGDISGSYMDHLNPSGEVKRDSYIYSGPSQSSKPAQQASYLDGVSSGGSPAANSPFSQNSFLSTADDHAMSASYMDALSPPSSMKQSSYIYSGGSAPKASSSYLDNLPEEGSESLVPLPSNPAGTSAPRVVPRKAISEEMKTQTKRFVPFESIRRQLSGMTPDKIKQGWFSVEPDRRG